MSQPLSTTEPCTEFSTRFVANIKSMPPLPKVAQQIIDRLDDEFIDGNEVADIIAQDPAISGRLLGLANSAYFGLSQPVANMRDVVNRVFGADHVRTLAFALATRQSFDTGKCQHFDANSFWRQSLLTATFCKRISLSMTTLEPHDRDYAFVLGLCQGIGLLALAFVDPERLDQLLTDAPQSDAVALDNALMQEFGATNWTLTAALAKHWNMPDKIVDTYSAFGAVGDGLPPLAIMLQTAVNAANAQSEQSFEDDMPHAHIECFNEHALALGIEPEKLDQALNLSESQAYTVNASAQLMSG
ncbi:MAG: HDOD domain-containing protein [Pseudomonadota bacterium]